MKYIGRIKEGHSVYISRESPNQHCIITGISGSGKSVRILDIERYAVEKGGTIIAVDINGTHEQVDADCFNFISAQDDGLNIRFLDTSLVEMKRESLPNLIQYAIETLAPREMRGACQLAVLRKAIIFAIEHREDFPNEMSAVLSGLEQQEETAALGAYNHLYSILEGGVFRESSKSIVQGQINLISMHGLNPKSQKRVTEMLLSALWREKRMEGHGRSEQPLTLVLDEFQNLDFRKGSVLFELLTEGRKYGIEVIMATQTLAVFPKKDLAVINQAAVKLFFQPSITDIPAVSDMIEPGRKEKWKQKLSHLRIGEAISVGSFELGGRLISQPIITYSNYDETTLKITSV